MKRARNFLQSAGLALLCLLAVSASHAARVALVIGNAQYQNEKPLKNPVNDAHALARTLKEDLQFDDVVERSNVTRRELGRLIDQLGQRAQGADAVVVYYSGHGMQGAGGNYLIPVDAQITSTEDIKLEGVSANDVVDVLNQSGARVALLVLDACRDNPFRTRTKSGSKGLARMNVSGGNLLVAYATQEGDTADDGVGNNSPYAQALIQNLKRKDLRVLEVFDEVAQQVKASTAQKQRPTRYGDLPVNVFLTGAPTQVASIDPVPVRPGPRGPAGGVANFGDLEQAQKEEAAARKKWGEWQARMKADFNKVAGFSGNAELEAKAWERFLAAYAEDNPYSEEDDRLRREGDTRRKTLMVEAAPRPASAQPSAVSAPSGSPDVGGARALCFFDWMGQGSERFAMVNRYAQAMGKQGVKLNVKSYVDERVAAEDFRNGACDALFASTARTRQFNPVAATVDSLGATLVVRDGRFDPSGSKEVVRKFLQTLASPPAGKLMSSGDFEVGGIVTSGGVHLVLRDRQLASVESMAGKKVGVFDYDKPLAAVTQLVGAQPVSIDATTWHARFNGGALDVVAAPAEAYKLADLQQGAGRQGGVLQVPLHNASSLLILRSDKFAPGFGQKSREYWVTQFDTTTQMAERAAGKIPTDAWINLDAQSLLKYVLVLRESRVELAKTGVYDKNGLNIAKRVRCSVNPNDSECATSKEAN